MHHVCGLSVGFLVHPPPTFYIFVHILDDAGQRGHVLLRQGHAQIVADEVVPGLEHRGGDEVQDAGGKAEELADKETKR